MIDRKFALVASRITFEQQTCGGSTNTLAILIWLHYVQVNSWAKCCLSWDGHMPTASLSYANETTWTEIVTW